MKHLILAAALLGATATTALAQQAQKPVWPAPPSEQVEKAGKKALVDKTKEMESSIATSNYTKAEQNANEVLRMMIHRVSETRVIAENHTGAEKDAFIAHLLALEKRVGTFRTDSKDVKTNGQKLIAQAREYITQY